MRGFGRAPLSEFTGERLVPGEVDADLWNEHVSRYAFAASFCRAGMRVLDAGCGTGYGSTVLSPRAGPVLGLDLSEDAVCYAARRYGGPRVRFVVARCEALPVPDESCDLLVAFEVIEHLDNWREFLSECRRVLGPGGVLFVSTPNQNFYTESRGDAGPNPFHVHEFDFDEFTRELEQVFPHVRLYGQNHAESIAFSAAGEPGVAVQLASLHSDPRQAGFFLAVCGKRELPAIPNFIYVPEAANVLRERERHIRLLSTELEAKNAEHAGLVVLHRGLESELARSNTWAASLDQQLQGHAATIQQLQRELEESNTWAEGLDRELQARTDRVMALQQELAEEQARAAEEIARLGSEIESRTAWARDLDAQLAAQIAELARCVNLLHAAEKTVDERTKWAQALDLQLTVLNAKMASYEASRWVKLGGKLHVGPLSQ
jgi:ubiquinone/menaquinone biosynthesis C-methylase UbiE